MNPSFHDHAWLFPGQGAQEIGMGRALLDKFSPARDILSQAESLTGEPLVSIIQRGPESRLTQTDVLQPALVAISVAYVELLREAGAAPKVVAGHSLGEISALFAAGVINLSDALKLATERGRLMNQASEGGMVAIKDLPPEKIEAILAEFDSQQIVVANYNAPSQTVISGQLATLDAAIPLLSAAGGGCVRLNVSGAWHSPLVANAARQFETVLDSVSFHAPQIPIVMGVTGNVETDPVQICAIMKRQITSPVRWTSVLKSIRALDCDKYLEVGPGKVLRGLLRKNIEDQASYAVAGVDSSKTVNELVAATTRQATT